MLVRHVLAPKEAEVVGMVEEAEVVGMVEEVEEVEGADTKIPVSCELRPL